MGEGSLTCGSLWGFYVLIVFFGGGSYPLLLLSPNRQIMNREYALYKSNLFGLIELAASPALCQPISPSNNVTRPYMVLT